MTIKDPFELKSAALQPVDGTEVIPVWHPATANPIAISSQTLITAVGDLIDQDFATQNARITASEGDIAVLETEMNTAQADIDTVEARVTQTEADIANIVENSADEVYAEAVNLPVETVAADIAHVLVVDTASAAEKATPLLVATAQIAATATTAPAGGDLFLGASSGIPRKWTAAQTAGVVYAEANSLGTSTALAKVLGVTGAGAAAGRANANLVTDLLGTAGVPAAIGAAIKVLSTYDFASVAAAIAASANKVIRFNGGGTITLSSVTTFDQSNCCYVIEKGTTVKFTGVSAESQMVVSGNNVMFDGGGTLDFTDINYGINVTGANVTFDCVSVVGKAGTYESGRIAATGAGFCYRNNSNTNTGPLTLDGSNQKAINNSFSGFLTGIYVQTNATIFEIIGNKFLSVYGTGGVAGYDCILVESVASPKKYGIVHGNTLKATREHGIYVSAYADSIRITENVIAIEGSGDYLSCGIKVAADPGTENRNITIANNTIRGGIAHTGILLDSAIRCQVHNNIIVSMNVGIMLGDTMMECKIYDNEILDSATAGIRVLDGSGEWDIVTIARNSIMRWNTDASGETAIYIPGGGGRAFKKLSILDNMLGDENTTPTGAYGVFLGGLTGGTTQTGTVVRGTRGTAISALVYAHPSWVDSDIEGFIHELAAADTTPFLGADNVKTTANASACVITAIDGLPAGKSATLIIGDANTTIDCTATDIVNVAGASDLSPGSGDVVLLRRMNATKVLAQMIDL